MNEVKNFVFKEQQIRVVTWNGQPAFVAKDVCDILDIENSRHALSRLEADEKGVVSNDTLGGTQKMQVVNEYGLYSLLLGSRKPEAKEFKRWVTHEVLPSIRKHGAYMTPETIEDILLTPDTMIRLATILKEEQTRRKEAEATIKQNEPKVRFTELIEASHSTTLIGTYAKILRQNGVDIGQNRLFRWMRENDYLCHCGKRKNQPTQKAMELGLFEVKERVITRENLPPFVVHTTMLTGRGQTYFMEMFVTSVEQIRAARAKNADMDNYVDRLFDPKYADV